MQMSVEAIAFGLSIDRNRWGKNPRSHGIDAPIGEGYCPKEHQTDCTVLYRSPVILKLT